MLKALVVLKRPSGSLKRSTGWLWCTDWMRDFNFYRHSKTDWYSSEHAEKLLLLQESQYITNCLETFLASNLRRQQYKHKHERSTELECKASKGALVHFEWRRRRRGWTSANTTPQQSNNIECFKKKFFFFANLYYGEMSAAIMTREVFGG